VAVANGIDGVCENVRQVDAEPSCLSAIWTAERISRQRESESAWTMQHLARMMTHRLRRHGHGHAHQLLHRGGASREAHHSGYLHSRANATRSSAWSAD